MDLSIVEELQDSLKNSELVHAMWIAGSVAEGHADKYSDIDLWADIEDGKDQKVYELIEEVLQRRGTIEISYEEDMRPPYTHKVYRLAGSNPYHFIEITLHTHSHKHEMIEGLSKIKVLFDKDESIKFKPHDSVTHSKMLKDRRRFLLDKIEIGKVSVRKEIERNQFMDAMHNYQFWLLEPIVELFRIKYSPLKISYGLKHGNRDLPEDVVTKIESLYMLNSIEDLDTKIAEVEMFAQEL